MNLCHHRTGLPLQGCPASNSIKGNHERDAYGYCHLCGSGPAIRATPSPSTAPTEQNQAKSLPARRFVSVKGFWDADYVEFAEGCAKGGGVLDGVHRPKHYTRRQAESYVSEGAWREVAVPQCIEQSVPAGAARVGGNTSDKSDELSSTAPIAKDERAAINGAESM